MSRKIQEKLIQMLEENLTGVKFDREIVTKIVVETVETLIAEEKEVKTIFDIFSPDFTREDLQ